MRNRTFSVAILLLFTLMLKPSGISFGQVPIPPPDIQEKELLIPWLDSLGGLWVVQNSSGHIPFKGTHPAQSGKRPAMLRDEQDIRDSLSAMSGEIRLEYNEMVAFYIDDLLNGNAGKTELLLGLSAHYLPYTDSLLAAEGMPYLLRYLPMAHSALYYKAVSDKGASGPWHLMYSSALRYGLRVDSYVDERRDYNAATRASIRMLGDLYEIYGDWSLAIGAFSCGPATINKAIRRSGGQRTYYGIYPNLPSPERAYLPLFTALAFVMEHHEDLGLVPTELVWPGKEDTVWVGHQLHLGQVAEVMDLPIGMLRDMNPAYKHDVLPGEAGKVLLRLPEGRKEGYLALADSIAAYNDSLYFTAPKRAVARTSSSGSQPTSYKGKTAITYTVKPGDNLGYIAQKFNVTVSQVKYWNGIHGTLIRAGQRLTIYVPDSKADYYQGKAKTSSSSSSSSSKPSASASSGSSGNYTIYTVRQGDNPSTIAARFPGVSAQDIMRFNNISNPRSLRVGQKLKIPKN